ncbi:MAG: cupin domain-containing protein [Bacteroidales bacterium]|nr:cupin domain-containing protein [Bacteroidales bacterium]
MKDEAGFVEIASGVFRKIATMEHLMVAVIDFTGGPMKEPDPYHSHEHEQITYVVSGRLKFIIEGEVSELQAGDTITIPSGKSHTIQTLTPEVRLVDSFSPIREDFL